MTDTLLASKYNSSQITQTQFNPVTDYYGKQPPLPAPVPIIAYATDVPDYATNFYFNGQTLDSIAGGTASNLVIFDTTTSSTFTSVVLPDVIQAGLKVPEYTYLEISGTIPLSMNYQLAPNSASNGIGRLTAQGVGVTSGATAKQLTYWFSASNFAAQTPTPSVGDSQWFTLLLKIGDSILRADSAIQLIISNPDTNAYASGQGSRLIVAGGGVAASTTNLTFKLI